MKGKKKGDSKLMKAMLKEIRNTKLIKALFKTEEQKKFLDSFFGFIIPIMCTLIKDLGVEEAFEFVFSKEFKSMLVSTLVKMKNEEQAEKVVDQLFKDMNLKLKKDGKDKKNG